MLCAVSHAENLPHFSSTFRDEPLIIMGGTSGKAKAVQVENAWSLGLFVVTGRGALFNVKLHFLNFDPPHLQ